MYNQHSNPTLAGRAISARNALKHGCCSAETLILPSESQEEFKSLENAWFRAYEPKGQAEVHLVHQLVQADWFLQRAIRTLALMEAELLTAHPNPLHWDETQQRTLARFLRYQTARANAVAKHRKAIEDFRRNRALEAARAQTSKHNIERIAIAQARLKVFEQKNQPEDTWHEHLEGMRRQALSLGFTPK